MAISSINSNLAALLAQQNIGNATQATSNNVAALSSGSRIVQASSDVAALATGTALQSQVTILNTALTVASQGNSLLQVADGALAQVQGILQRQQAIATQAQSGSLSATQLGFLNQEFQNLTDEIDRLSGSTNFNGVNLLTGALSESVFAKTNSAHSTAASGGFTVTTNATDGNTLVVNGQTVTFDTTPTAGQVQVGNTIAQTVQNLAEFLNGAAGNSSLTAAQKSAWSKAVYSVDGSTLNIAARNGGTLGSTFTIGADTGAIVITKNGQFADSSASISDIATATTSTALTFADTTLNSGALTFNGQAIATITLGTSTLDSVVADINAGSTTTGISAYITGSAGDYTLNVKASDVAATGFSATGALAAVGTTSLYTVNDPTITRPYTRQTITFDNITYANRDVTLVGASGRLQAGGDITFDYGSGSVTYTVGSADTLEDVRAGLETALQNVSGLEHSAVTITSLSGGTQSGLYIDAEGDDGTGTGIATSGAYSTAPFNVLNSFAATHPTADSIQTLTITGLASTTVDATGGTNFQVGDLIFDGATITITGGETLEQIANMLEQALNTLNGTGTSTVVANDLGANTSLVITDSGTNAGAGVSGSALTGATSVASSAVSHTTQTLDRLDVTISSASADATANGLFLTGSVLTFNTAVYTIQSGDSLNDIKAGLQNALHVIDQGTLQGIDRSTVVLADQGGGVWRMTVTDHSSSGGSGFASTGSLLFSTSNVTPGVVSLSTTESTVTTITGINVANSGTAGQPFADDLFVAGALVIDGVSVTLAGTESLTGVASAIQTALINAGRASATAGISGGTGNYTLTVTDTGYSSDSPSGFDTTSAALAAVGPISETYTTSSIAHNTVAGLAGGDNSGLGINGVIGTGTLGDNVLVGQNQAVSKVTITYPSISSSDLLTTDNFGASSPASITVGGVQFNFTTTAGSSSTEIEVGSTLAETLDNAVAKINAYQGTGTENYLFGQIQAVRDGNSLILQGKNVGTVTNIDGTTASTASASGASVAVSGNFSNGSTAGIDTSGVTNSAWIGKVTGFTATYANSANTVNLSVTVGDHTYTANNVSTNPTSNTSVTLVSSDGGGYFTIQQQALSGSALSSQGGANSYATRLNAAIGGLTFYQNRSFSSYDASNGGTQGAIFTDGVSTGSLVGSSVRISQGDFSSNLSIDAIKVSAPQGTNPNGSISFSINGDTYSNLAAIGGHLAANTTYTFVNSSDAGKAITFTTGGTGIDFSTDAKASSFQSALAGAFGVGQGSTALTFQVGTSTSDIISVSIGSAKTSSLFGGVALDVLSQAHAATAADVLETALNTVTALRATVGALEERFDYASKAIQNAVQNESAAKSALLDTDVASTSTAFATSQVQLQAGIAVLAQANQLQQNLLKLIA